MLFGFLIRSGSLIGVIYYTKKVGIWGSPYETEKLYCDIKNELRPHVQKLEQQMPFDFPALPKTGEICFLAKHYYNEGVKKSFNTIEMVPTYTFNMISFAKNKIEDVTKSSKAEK